MRPDHCKTAEDVRTAAIRVSRFRKEHRPHPKPFLVELVKVAEFLPPPKPVFDPIPIIPPAPVDPLPNQVRVIDIQRAICRKFNIELNDLLSARRHRSIVIPRHVSWALCRILTLKSYPEIGRRTGGRDHTTIYYGVEKFNWLRLRLSIELNTFQPLSVWVNRAFDILVEKGIVAGQA